MPVIDDLPTTDFPSMDHAFPAIKDDATVQLKVQQVYDLIRAALVDGAPTALDTLNELANALGDDPDFAATLTTNLEAINTALALRLRVDAAQGLTDLQKGQARANMDGVLLSGFRNKVINPDFHHWQRWTASASITNANVFGADRWLSSRLNSTCTFSRQAFTLGQADVPDNPRFFGRCVVGSVANAANFSKLEQRIEEVETFAGKKCTVTFWAKADANKNIALELAQIFGTGGSPSAAVTALGAQLIALTTSWQKFTRVITIPGISGKTRGTDGNDYLQLNFWFDAGSNFNARTAALGQQSGTFDISHVSIVEGDATGEDNPTAPRRQPIELMLCERYFQRIGGFANAPAGTGLWIATNQCSICFFLSTEMREPPVLASVGNLSSTWLLRYAANVVAVASVINSNFGRKSALITFQTATSPAAAGDGGYLRVANDSDYVGFDAEI